MTDLVKPYIPPPTGQTQTALGRILVVDDNPLSRVVLERVLEGGFHETVTAKDGEQAWELVLRGEVDLVVADYRMPGLTGFELCQRIKTHPELHLTPVIIVTGADDIASRIAAFEHGADDILPKPVINEELLARVRNLLRFSSLVRERLESQRTQESLRRELTVSLLEREREEMEKRLYRDVLFAATGGRLHLLPREEMAAEISDWTEVEEMTLSEVCEISAARRLAERLGEAVGMSEEAVADVVLCVSEAVTNALKFGTQVLFRCGRSGNEVRLMVEDNGPGVERALLPHVTLHKGYSTGASMGMGFSLMLETMDSVGLTTDTGGTTVLLKKQISHDPDQAIDAFLERFSVDFDL